MAKPLKCQTVIPIFMDRSGILWAGTDGRDVNKIYPKTQKFSSHDPNGSSDGASSDPIRTILEDRSGSLWIGKLAPIP